MDEDEFNMSIRKVLQKVGIASQREIERAIRSGLDCGVISEQDSLIVFVILHIDQQDPDLVIDGEIKLQ